MVDVFHRTNEEYAEGKIMLKCLESECPNILPLVEVLQNENTTYLVTKLVTGGSLFDQMQVLRQKKEISERAAKHIFR